MSTTRAATVPFLDLGAIHGSLKQEILEAIAEIVDSGAFINGPQVNSFEAAFAGYCGLSACAGLASGLDALRLALQALEIGAGDEVLVPANTFIASFEAITQAGARPVPVDASEDDYNLDPEALSEAISRRTRAVMPVHLYGQMADMATIAAIAGANDLAIVEDACQAHGASRTGIRPGATGPAAFSFYPGKNLGAFGDAGALVSSDEGLIERVKMLREHGQRQKYRHEAIGYTARLDTIQAAVLLRKLPHLDGWNEARRSIAALYEDALLGVGDLRLPPVPEGSEPVWHLYVVRTEARDELAGFLRERGIATGLHYPEPPHLSAAYRALGYKRGDFPIAERLADEVLSLPIFPGMTEGQSLRVVEQISEFFRVGV